jgi:hypothetical protein
MEVHISNWKKLQAHVMDMDEEQLAANLDAELKGKSRFHIVKRLHARLSRVRGELSWAELQKKHSLKWAPKGKTQTKENKHE